MYRMKSKSVAEQIANEQNLFHGFCVFDGKWYVGTRIELERCGCIDENVIAPKSLTPTSS